MAARIKTGTAAWADRALVTTGWYPPHVRTAQAKLQFYASQFSLVENDAGYWAVLERSRVATWAERMPPDFTMNVKAHALLTGHYAEVRGLPKDIRESLSREVLAKPHVYPRDLGDDVMHEIEARVHDALAPLHDAGKLGVALFQFPVWFPASPDNEAQLVRIADRFQPYRIAIEFRNATWTNERHLERTLALLSSAGLIYTCVDEPQGLVASVPPVAAVTGEIALVRMHGRNAARWTRPTRTALQRFEYLYSRDELREWVPKILAMADHADEVHVVLANAYLDRAVRNAREITDLIEDARSARERERREPEPMIVVP